MSRDERIFRSCVVGGFNKEDVNNYIEGLFSSIQQEKALLKDKTEELSSENQMLLNELEDEKDQNLKLRKKYSQLLEKLGLNTKKELEIDRRIKRTLLEKSNKICALNSEISKKDALIAELKSRLEDKGAEKKAADEKIERMAAQAEKFKSALFEKGQLIEKLSNELSDAQSQADEHDKTIRKLQDIEPSARAAADEVRNRAAQEARNIISNAVEDAESIFVGISDLVCNTKIQAVNVCNSYLNIMTSIDDKFSEVKKQNAGILAQFSVGSSINNVDKIVLSNKNKGGC